MRHTVNVKLYIYIYIYIYIHVYTHTHESKCWVEVTFLRNGNGEPCSNPAEGACISHFSNTLAKVKSTLNSLQLLVNLVMATDFGDGKR